MIKAKAERWDVFSEVIDVNIEKTSEGVLVNGVKAKQVIFNNIQLRFVMSNGIKIILIDGRTGSELTIKEMYEQIK